MSAEIYSASGNNASLPQRTTVGGSKPLHRFIKGQPKINGIIVLVIGSSSFIISIASMNTSVQHIWTAIPPGLLMGILFSICGILYVVTEHNPTKKTVTLSLALSIVTILTACWTVLHTLPDLIHSHIYYGYYADHTTETEEAVWSSYYAVMELSMEVVVILHIFTGTIITIVMSTLAGMSLRSTRSQAIVVMTASPTETPVE